MLMPATMATIINDIILLVVLLVTAITCGYFQRKTTSDTLEFVLGIVCGTSFMLFIFQLLLSIDVISVYITQGAN